MNPLDSLQLLAELANEWCELNHGPGTRSRDYPAANYLVTPIGYQEGPGSEVAARELVVPVCAACIDALLGEEWTLLYCFECGSSQWISRQLARFTYRHHILWLRGCPECTHEFGGIYFSDQRAVAGEVSLLSHYHGTLAA